MACYWLPPAEFTLQLSPSPKVILSLLPMFGIAFVMWAIGRAILRADELQRRCMLEIIAWSSGTTMFLSLAYGFLEFGIGLPKLSMFLVWPVMAVSWIVTGIVYALLGKVAWIWPWPRQ